MLSIETFHLNENLMQYSNYDGVDDLEMVLKMIQSQLLVF
jgi:hypothetical protein